MQTQMGMNNKAGIFTKVTDDSAEIMFHMDDIMHRVLVNAEGRIRVVRGAEDVYDSQVEDYCDEIDKGE